MVSWPDCCHPVPRTCSPAMQDGAQNDELWALASTGNHGMHKGNLHCDLMAYSCKDLTVAPSVTVHVQCIDPKTNKDSTECASIFLPHLQFWSLGLHFPQSFNDCFSLAKGLPSFWGQRIGRVRQYPSSCMEMA